MGFKFHKYLILNETCRNLLQGDLIVDLDEYFDESYENFTLYYVLYVKPVLKIHE